MTSPISVLVQHILDEVTRAGADKLLLGNLPEGVCPGDYTGPRETLSPDDERARIRELEKAMQRYRTLVGKAMSHAGLDGLPLESDLPGGLLPIWCHIPACGGWCSVDGFPSHLLPHVMIEMQKRLRRKETIASLRMEKNLSCVLGLAK